MSKQTHRSLAFKNHYQFKSNYVHFAYLFCKKLGISEDDMVNFISFSKLPDNLKNYKIITSSAFSKMQTALNEAYKAGEDKEHERHIKEEDNSFKKGVKYGEEKERNKNKISKKSKNELDDMFLQFIIERPHKFLNLLDKFFYI